MSYLIRVGVTLTQGPEVVREFTVSREPSAQNLRAKMRVAIVSEKNAIGARVLSVEEA